MPTKGQILDLLNSLNVNYQEYTGRVIGPCPVHLGDNPTAWNINVDEDSEYFGNWFCNTRGCHTDHFDITGLVQLLLKCDYKTALEIIKLDKPSDDTNLKFWSKKVRKSNIVCSRDYVRSRLLIPPEFYLKRGFSKEILEEFDVGLCEDINAQMFKRVVFPVYNKDGMVGCTGRTINGDPKKWTVSKGFSKSHFLYGFWKTEEHIREKGDIILVEGQGDVLKLYDAGIKNVVGIFGTSLSESQEFLIQKTGAMNLHILMDNDEAGKKARKDIRKKMQNLFNIYDVFTDKDPGDMSDNEIQKLKKEIIL